MAEGQGYIGRSPGDSAVIIASQTFEPTGIQTNFTFASGYDPGYIDVYLNGARLIYANDYTATDGSTVALVDAAANGDVLECVAYKAFNVATIDSAPGNLTVGNKLTVSGVTTATSAYYTGIVTASSFSGDGSALTGVASTDNIITSTASTFTGNVWVGAAISISGISTVYNDTQSTSTADGALVVYGGVGIAKSLNVGGNVTVGGTITYEDVTNQDVIGLSTFRNGVQFGVAGVGGTIDGVGNAIISGVTTLSGDIRVPDDKKLHFGNIGGAFGDLQLWHDDGAHSYIRDQGSGDLRIYGSAVDIRDNAGTASVARFTDNSVHLAGITTVGILTAYDSLTVSVWTLGADGTSHYTFSGPGDLSAENDPDLQLIRGQRYIFRNRSGGHPFRIQSDVNGSAGTAYNDGVTNNDAADGTDLRFDVPFDAPSVLYYQCTAHANMGGVIYIGSSSGDDVNVGTAISMYASSGIVSATAFYGDGSQLEGVSASGGGDIDITSCLFI